MPRPGEGLGHGPAPEKEAKTLFFPKKNNVFGVRDWFKAFSRPWHQISRQQFRIWMRICRVTAIFVALEVLGIRTLRNAGLGRVWDFEILEMHVFGA